MSDNNRMNSSEYTRSGLWEESRNVPRGLANPRNTPDRMHEFRTKMDSAYTNARKNSSRKPRPAAKRKSGRSSSR